MCLKNYYFFIVFLLAGIGCKDKEKRNDISTYHKDTLVIAGSETLMPIIKGAAPLFQKVNKDYVLNLSGGGSIKGLEWLKSGNADIALASHQMSAESKSDLEANNKTVKELEIAKIGYAIIVNKKNILESISLEQLKAMYTGRIKNWKELGGNNEPVMIYSRDSKSGAYEFFYQNMLNNAQVAPSVRVLPNNQMMEHKVSEHAGAIGYISSGFIAGHAKTLTIIDIGSEEFKAPLYLYYLLENEEKVKPFINFILSEQGHKVIMDQGFIYTPN